MQLIYTVPQAHVIVIERFGKFSRIQSQGLHFRLPFIERVKVVREWGGVACKEDALIELAEQHTDTPPRQCHTMDNVSVMANASVYWKIIDPRRALYEVDVLPKALSDVALNALRSVIGKVQLDKLLSSREEINQIISAQLKETCEKWGILLTRVEIQELSTSDATAEAMHQEMVAERRRRAKIAEAEGESRAKVLVAQAEAEALDLIAQAESRYLETLKTQVGAENAARVLLAQKLLDGYRTISTNPANKVFLPNGFQAIFNVDGEVPAPAAPSRKSGYLDPV